MFGQGVRDIRVAEQVQVKQDFAEPSAFLSLGIKPVGQLLPGQKALCYEQFAKKQVGSRLRQTGDDLCRIHSSTLNSVVHPFGVS